MGTLVTALVALADTGWSAPWFVMSGTLLGCLAYLALKIESSRRQAGELRRLQAAYDQLDQQTKLIIRTDLELHHTQEELDRWLASLMSLHHLGRQLQVSLRPEEVLSRLDAAVVSKFGFTTGLLGICPSFQAIEWRSLVGVDAETAAQAASHLVEQAVLKQILTNPAPTTLAAADALTPAQRRLLELLRVPTMVVAGVMPHSGPAGCLLLGRAGSATNPKADEELVAILANQLASAIESSALYEQAWAAQHELERKVQERTRELADANAALVRLNKAKSDFVSAVSHELRTPLAAIKGYSALLHSGQFGPLAAPQAERIAKIEKHTDLLTHFINNLLDIARIESGRTTMERRPIPVKEFLETVHEMVHPQLQAKQLRYTVDLNSVSELLGDPAHLQRVFVNLLSNAIKYTPDGGAIHLGMQRDGTVVTASVSDTGCGIAPDDLAKLFQEFYRANDPINQQIRGTGLGLALVKRIVEAHGGRIWVKSEKGNGSTFFVSLPVA
ncbi:MAG: HAMP domain-containing sensor histidine kinase [Candidatus Omnitrophota bacterium]|nr:HAMP domain-containing sensor histidine kinase [Candidatus Omnitrophota bacterium]